MPSVKFSSERLKYIHDLALDESSYDSEYLNLSFNEKIELRKAVVTLASEFAVHLPNLETNSLSVIDEWRQISERPNEFAEVRAAWRGV